MCCFNRLWLVSEHREATHCAPWETFYFLIPSLQKSLDFQQWVPFGEEFKYFKWIPMTHVFALPVSLTERPSILMNSHLYLTYLVKEKEMTTHSNTLAWKSPWMEEPGRLQSMGSQRVGHDWVTSLSLSRENSSNSTNKACVISTTTSPTLFFMIKAKQGLWSSKIAQRG